MTRTIYARIAGFMFIFYIVTGIASMILFNQAINGAEGTASKLASIAQHAPLVRISALLTLLTGFDAVVLAVALYALTRDQDHDLAMMALCCRVCEGVIGAIATVKTLGLLSIATASTAATPEAAQAQAIGGLLLGLGGVFTNVSASCFAVGSTLYSYLFLRARSIPTWLAWLGIFASVLLVVLLPAQLLELINGLALWFMWLPMLVFEVALALWLLVKGVAAQPAGA